MARNLLNISLRLSFNDNRRIAGLQSGNGTEDLRATTYQSMYKHARAACSCPGQGCHLDTFSSRDCHFDRCFGVVQKFWLSQPATDLTYNCNTFGL